MQKIIIGNWKMHGDVATATALVEAVVKDAASYTDKIQVVMCPPACLLYTAGTHLSGSGIKMGGQDCHSQPEGAFTGGISAPMLKDAGCDYVIVGHSERRKYHHETNEEVRGKAARAIKSGLIPIICIGETEEERASGATEAVLGKQIRECIPEEAIGDHFILAYEPVWAIGSGKTPTVDEIKNIHTYIVLMTAKRTRLDTSRIHVIYGGSVKASNARDIMAPEEVSGVLVGGASLKAEEFCGIIKAAV